jgi:hypothetical protein
MRAIRLDAFGGPEVLRRLISEDFTVAFEDNLSASAR